MNFGKIYIKSALFLIQMLLAFNFAYSQEYILEFKNTSESEKKLKKYKSYKDLILAIEDTLIFIKKQGFYDAKVNSLTRKDSLNYQVILNKNQMIKYIQISNKKKLGDRVIKILNDYSIGKELIKFEEIQSIAEEITGAFSKTGYPFTNVSFKNHKLIDTLTIEAEIKISYGSKRYIDRVIVQGYEDFPKKFIDKIFMLNKNKPLDIEKALIRSSLIDRTNFGRKKRDPEIMFTKDSTTLYLYIEKIKRNSFDSFLSFDTDENSGKINVQGYAKINLHNTFNSGEKLNFDFQSQKNQDRSLASQIYIPYIFATPINLNYKLNLVKKDSSYTSNESLIDFDMGFGDVRGGLGLQINKSNRNEETENVENFVSKSINIFTEYSIIDKEDKLIPELFKFSARYGRGLKKQLGDKINFSNYSIELHKKFNFSSRLKFQSSIVIRGLDSKNLLNNELLRFGGFNSIRGFEDNGIFANKYILFNTNLNYYLNDNIYVYTIFDLANYTNKILSIDNNIYSGGFGLSTKSDNGIISMTYSKGNDWGERFNLKNAKISINFLTFF
tara:strand:+ start:2853 stop:4520 length:1668 start_codon:yes stop_codon:yes gene_type:complete